MSRKDSDVLRLMLFTVLGGALTFLLTNALNQPLGTSLTLSVLIGGMMVVVRFMMSFEKRLEALARSTQGGELFFRLEAAGGDRDVVESLMSDWATIASRPPSVIRDVARSEMLEIRHFLRALAAEDVAYKDGEDRNWLLALTKHARASIDAVSLASVDRDFWDSELGERYLKLEGLRVGNGVKIRRIFLLDIPTGTDDTTIRRAYRYQIGMGIDVRVLDANRADRPMQVSDSIIFDGRYTYETTAFRTVGTESHPSIKETRLDSRAWRVADSVRDFDHLWALAETMDLADAGAPAEKNGFADPALVRKISRTARHRVVRRTRARSAPEPTGSA